MIKHGSQKEKCSRFKKDNHFSFLKLGLTGLIIFYLKASLNAFWLNSQILFAMKLKSNSPLCTFSFKEKLRKLTLWHSKPLFIHNRTEWTPGCQFLAFCQASPFLFHGRKKAIRVWKKTRRWWNFNFLNFFAFKHPVKIFLAETQL